MPQGIIIGKKRCDRVSRRKENYATGFRKQKFCFYSVSETCNFYATGIHSGHFLCHRAQGVERFSTLPHHFPSQVTSRALNIPIEMKTLL